MAPLSAPLHWRLGQLLQVGPLHELCRPRPGTSRGRFSPAGRCGDARLARQHQCDGRRCRCSRSTASSPVAVGRDPRLARGNHRQVRACADQRSRRCAGSCSTITNSPTTTRCTASSGHFHAGAGASDDPARSCARARSRASQSSTSISPIAPSCSATSRPSWISPWLDTSYYPQGGDRLRHRGGVSGARCTARGVSRHCRAGSRPTNCVRRWDRICEPNDAAVAAGPAVASHSGSALLHPPPGRVQTTALVLSSIPCAPRTEPARAVRRWPCPRAG